VSKVSLLDAAAEFDLPVLVTLRQLRLWTDAPLLHSRPEEAMNKGDVVFRIYGSSRGSG
jgi:hypothetical protein